LIHPALTSGWPALRRGLPQSYLELELASPGAATLTWLGHQLEPVLRPLTQRAHPLSPLARATLAGGALALGWWMGRRLGRRA
jgi:hypothetical protein